MKKNKNIGLIILIIILIIALLGTSGYIVYDKFIKEESTKVENKKEEDDTTNKVTKKEITTSAKNQIMDQIETYVAYYADLFNYFDVNDLSNNDILYFAYLNDRSGEYSSSSLGKIIKKYFGDIDVTYTDIICPVENSVLFKFDKNTSTYSYNENHPGHGGGILYRSENYFVDGYSIDNTYVVNTKILYGSSCGDTCGPITDYYKDIDSNTSIFEVPSDGNDNYDYTLTDADYESLKDKLPITTFTFEKDSDGNYSLKTIKIN